MTMHYSWGKLMTVGGWPWCCCAFTRYHGKLIEVWATTQEAADEGLAHWITAQQPGA